MPVANARTIAAFLIGVAIVAAGCAFAWAYVAAEDQVYFWDNAGYFDRFGYFGDRFARGDWGWVREAAYTIVFEEYNVSSIVPLLPLHALFGDSRTVYIVGLVALYLAPTWLVAATTSELARSGRLLAPTRLPLWQLTAAALYWPLWAPTLRGLPDVAGLIPLGLATILVLKPQIARAAPVRAGLAAGVLTWGAFILRRWYAYASASLLVLAGLFAAAAIVRDKEGRAETVRSAVFFFGACGAAMAALALLQLPIVREILGTSYATAYGGYQQPFLAQVGALYERFGPIVTIGALAGVVRAGLERAWRPLFLFACAIATFVFFSRTHAPSIHHTLPVAFFLFPVFVHGVAWPFEALKRPQLVWIAPALMALSFAAVFSPEARARLGPAGFMAPALETYPLRIENLDAYQRLIADVKARLGPEDQIAVFASSINLADAMLAAMDTEIAPHMASPSQIDTRDGFSLAPIEQRFVVVTDAPVLHVAPEGQRVISIPNTMIRSGSGFGAAYEQVLGPYALAGGVTAYVYERRAPLADADRAALIEEFRRHYPDWVEGDNWIGPP
jgi:hypothetical protein